MKHLKLFDAFKFDLLYGGLFSKYESVNFTLMGGHRVQGNLKIKDVDYYRLKYEIYSHEIFKETQNQEQSAVGTIELAREEDGSPVGLIDITLKPKFRKHGFGKEIIKELLEATKEGLYIFDIQKKAIKFWQKMGSTIEMTKFGTINGFISKNINEGFGHRPASVAPNDIFALYYKCINPECNTPFVAFNQINGCPTCKKKVIKTTKEEYINNMRKIVPAENWKQFMSDFEEMLDQVIPLNILDHDEDNIPEDDNYGYEES